MQGTPQYISPEQVQGVQASPRSDAYALGLTLFYLLSGRHLVDGDSVSEVIGKQLAMDLPPLVKDCKEIPGPVRQLLLSLIEREPARRPASLAPVIESLRRIGPRVGAVIMVGDEVPVASGWPTLVKEPGE